MMRSIGTLHDGRTASGGGFSPGGVPQYHEDTAFATAHVKLSLDIDIPKKAVRGVCETTLEALCDGAAKVSFHAVDMTIRGVSAKGKASHAYDGKTLRVDLARPVDRGERVVVRVSYALKDPKAGLTFIVPDKAYPKKPFQVWSQGQTDDSRYWFPCRDVPSEKATTEMVATVPESFTAVSNGALVGVAHDRAKRLKTFHWRMSKPHPLYLVTLAVGRFAEVRDEWDGIPISYYCEKGREADARRGFGKTPAMVRFFSERIGVRYPWEKYAQVAAHEFGGGMENTSATTQTDMVLLDSRAGLDTDFDGLVAHELAHQWFGDLVTCRSWSQGWLNEGFATYLDPLFQEHDKGPDAFFHDMRLFAQDYFEEDAKRYRRPIVTNVYKHSWSLFDRHLYQKAAWVLHLVRYHLGDDLWWSAIKHYVERFSFKCAETPDFVQAVEDATGRNIRPLIDQWVYGAGHPEYKASYRWDASAREACVWITQRQRVSDRTPLFRVPLEFRFETGGSLKTFKETVDRKEHALRFKLPAEPTAVWIDPDHWVLKKLEFFKPRSAWKRQLVRDKNLLGRMDAARELARWRTAEGVALIEKAFHREKYWAGRYELVKAIGGAQTDAAFEALKRCLKAADHRSRRGVAEALAEFPSKEAVRILVGLAKRDPAYRVRSAALRSLGRMRAEAAMPVIKAALRQDSWFDVVRRGAVAALASLEGTRCIGRLKELSAYGQPIPVRMEAVEWLGALGVGEKGVFEHLEKLLREPNRILTFAVVKALEALNDERVAPVLRKLAQECPQQWVRMIAEGALHRIREGLDPEDQGPLRKENESLKSENLRLKRSLTLIRRRR
ncbi:MAG: HEAT repeat domain-containing protein [Elusimicrobia bacterium]|nr:HEAT repeat domain-containing protein [Elusimicrobiota bacterium]